MTKIACIYDGTGIIKRWLYDQAVHTLLIRKLEQGNNRKKLDKQNFHYN